mmetsp:Transcript_89618/g.252860  ORF Transcript_89618/g.252860 Transcript_89618/m.252860 type:complete len:283 (+) Transcript_89618:1189-2037(+)
MVDAGIVKQGHHEGHVQDQQGESQPLALLRDRQPPLDLPRRPQVPERQSPEGPDHLQRSEGELVQQNVEAEQETKPQQFLQALGHLGHLVQEVGTGHPAELGLVGPTAELVRQPSCEAEGRPPRRRLWWLLLGCDGAARRGGRDAPQRAAEGVGRLSSGNNTGRGRCKGQRGRESLNSHSGAQLALWAAFRASVRRCRHRQGQRWKGGGRSGRCGTPRLCHTFDVSRQGRSEGLRRPRWVDRGRQRRAEEGRGGAGPGVGKFAARRLQHRDRPHRTPQLRRR